MLAGFDGDLSVASRGPHEFLDAPTGFGLDPAGYRQCGEHDGEVGLDRLAFVVEDRAGLQVVLGHPE